MNESLFYKGFPALPEIDELVDALIHDPPDVRWRVVRDLFRIEDRKDREELIRKLLHELLQAEDFRVNYRIKLAISSLQHPFRVNDYVVIKGKGAFKTAELEAARNDVDRLVADNGGPNFFPVIDFHVHPKSPDLKFFADLKEAGVTHAAILATDTDPSDVDRPEIREKLRKNFSGSSQAHAIAFEKVLEQIRDHLYSPSHVTVQDVADWVGDYPDALIGFGSVNLSRRRNYVERKLLEMERLGLRGIKLLPFSQFFNPAENENMNLLFEYCRRTRTIILSHSGCAHGPFELPELSGDSHPSLWEGLVKKFPDVPLVLAHFGSYSAHIPGIWLHDAMQLGKKYRNVYADLAAVNWLFSGVSLAYLVSRLKVNTILTEREKRKVLGENAARLLGIV